MKIRDFHPKGAVKLATCFVQTRSIVHCQWRRDVWRIAHTKVIFKSSLHDHPEHEWNLCVELFALTFILIEISPSKSECEGTWYQGTYLFGWNIGFPRRRDTHNSKCADPLLFFYTPLADSSLNT